MNFQRIVQDEILSPCITLVGMAGAGKSTLAPLLAQRLGWTCVDTDRLMEAHYAMDLQGIMDKFGLEQFKSMESCMVRSLFLHRTIISTGGSVVYSDAAVRRLRELGPVVNLGIGVETFKQRVGDATGRALAIAPGLTMEDLYNERQPLYRAAAHHTVPTDCDTPENCVQAILEQVDLT